MTIAETAEGTILWLAQIPWFEEDSPLLWQQRYASAMHATGIRSGFESDTSGVWAPPQPHEGD
jgi:hypothetical protein